MNWSRPPRPTDPQDPGDPGWWQASDGWWYPPESSWAPPSATPTSAPQPSRVWIGLLVGALAILAIVGIVVAVVTVADGSGSHDATTDQPTGTVPTNGSTPSSDTTPSSGPGLVPQPPLSSIVASRATVVMNPAPGSGVSVDVAEAKQVTARLWAAHVRARLERDAPLMKAVEDGPVLEADYGYLCYLGCHGPAATASSSVVNVPRQTSWPASFAADVTYTVGCGRGAQPPCVDAFVATQAARGRPWKIVMWTTYSGNTVSPEASPELSADGQYAVTATPPRIAANDLLDAYVEYLDTLKRTGQPPASTILAPGAFTSDRASELYDPPSKEAALGDTADVHYGVDPSDPTWTFATSESTTMVCGTIRYKATFAGLDGRAIVQPDDFRNFGTNVLPGRYATITQDGLHMVCFGLHPSNDPVYVLGTYGDDTTVETTPAP